MTEPTTPSHPVPAGPGATLSGHDVGPNFQAYIVIFAILCVCTALSFVVNAIMGQNAGSAAIILAVSVVKALCVALIFMHLKFDWGKLYFIMVPVIIMAVMMMIVLLPDFVLHYHHSP